MQKKWPILLLKIFVGGIDFFEWRIRSKGLPHWPHNLSSLPILLTMDKDAWQDEFIESVRGFINDQLDSNGDVDTMIDNVAANDKIKQIMKTIKAIEEMKRKQKNSSQ